ncbi:hypothetical protein, partial [Flavobacterium polysaccharolyticum]
ENFYSHLSLFLLSISQGTFRVLRGAKVSNVFISHKLFLIFFFQKSNPEYLNNLPVYKRTSALLRVQK